LRGVVEAAGKVDLERSCQHALRDAHGLVVHRVGRLGRQGKQGGLPGRYGLDISVGQFLKRLTAAFRPGIWREGVRTMEQNMMAAVTLYFLN
jgi:hypothetical protein